MRYLKDWQSRQNASTTPHIKTNPLNKYKNYLPYFEVFWDFMTKILCLFLHFSQTYFMPTQNINNFSLVCPLHIDSRGRKIKVHLWMSKTQFVTRPPSTRTYNGRTHCKKRSFNFNCIWTILQDVDLLFILNIVRSIKWTA